MTGIPQRAQALGGEDDSKNNVVEGAKVECTAMTSPTTLYQPNKYGDKTGLMLNMLERDTNPVNFAGNFGLCTILDCECILDFVPLWNNVADPKFSPVNMELMNNYSTAMATAEAAFRQLENNVNSEIANIGSGWFAQNFPFGRSARRRNARDSLSAAGYESGKSNLDVDIRLNPPANDADRFDLDARIGEGRNDIAQMRERVDLLTQSSRNRRRDRNIGGSDARQKLNAAVDALDALEEYKNSKEGDPDRVLKKESELVCWVGGLVTIPDEGQVDGDGGEELNIQPMSLSAAGVHLLVLFESFFAIPTRVLQEEFYTIGYGEYAFGIESMRVSERNVNPYFIHNGVRYDENNPMPREIAADLKLQTLTRFQDTVNNFLIGNNIQLTQNQFDALVIDAYQRGVSGWNSNDTLLDFILNGDHTDRQAAEAAFNNNSASVLGVQNRRIMQAEFFVTGEYTDIR